MKLFRKIGESWDDYILRYMSSDRFDLDSHIQSYNNKGTLAYKSDFLDNFSEPVIKNIVKPTGEEELKTLYFLIGVIEKDNNICIKHDAMFAFVAFAKAEFFSEVNERGIIDRLDKLSKRFADSVVFVHEYVQVLGYLNKYAKVRDILTNYKNTSYSVDVRQTAELSISRGT